MQNLQNHIDQTPLVSLAEFKRSGRCPIEPYHMIFHHKQSLVNAGAIVKHGRVWLVDEPKFFGWLREFGASQSDAAWSNPRK